MSKHLVIVESAGKIKKIGEYLGPNYIVKASLGHCMDLDPHTLSIDVQNNYKPNYIVSEGKHKIIKELKELALKSSSVILAADNDREGEAIAWSLADVLNLTDPPRIIFTEITKKAIQTAIENPIKINMDMVYAQQARRLLDRLVGYKISPILQKHCSARSAGRVQSVLVKIINDKEIEINNTLLSPYIKTTCDLEHNKNKINCVLSHKFESLEKGLEFLKLINKTTIFKVVDIQNKISIRKPSPPFITSSLQQEASTKLKFNVKKTMEVAQKLYEGGHITYMRTDSTNLSQEAINSCKKYILEHYGNKYSKPTNYSSSSNAQEAHEAIRPTHLNLQEIESSDKDQVKLYNLIWKRTMASQMAYANLDIQTITISSSAVSSTYQNMLWISTYQTIIFDGFLILYDNTPEDETEENLIGKVEIKINDILKFNKIKMFEEYNKLPLRYNEANLVKYLEKNNIGRPSTYATLIDKIIVRKYVEIKDIDGITKKINLIELDKKYKIKETSKDIVVGKEYKKIIPTKLGITITEFLEANFTDIMKIDFTAEFETYLDKIALGKAKWYNVLDSFYKMFNPTVEKLNKIIIAKEDQLLGIHPITKQEIFFGTGKYGPYIRVLDKYTSASDEITLEEAIELLEYPKLLGKINKKPVELAKGKFGLYLKYDNNNYSFTDTDKVIDLDFAKNIIESKNKYSLKSFTIKNKIIYVKNGQYGYYLQITSEKSKPQNIPIPKNTDINNIDIKIILEIIANKNGTKK
jgi:DNA topoisomerase-1